MPLPRRGITSRWFRSGGFTGKAGQEQVLAGIVHPGSVTLPRGEFDRLGENAIRDLFGKDVEITIVDDEPCDAKAHEGRCP